MDKIVIFIRKKISGLHSIEEIAKTLKNNIPDLVIKELPYDSSSLKGIIKNIFFCKKNQGKINHFIMSYDCYAGVLVRNKKIVTWHDLKTIKQSKSKFRQKLRDFLSIYPTYVFDKITAISDFTKGELLSELHFLKDEDIKVIPNPLKDIFKYSVRDKIKEKPTILHIGTAKRKNLENVILAVKDLNVRLRIIGILTDSQLELLKKHKIDYINEYNVTTNRIYECYKECDIVSFPSSYEGFGMPIIEAQAVGRPIITSEIEPIKSISQDSVIYVDPNDYNSIKEGFKYILDNKNKSIIDNLITNGIKNAERFKEENVILEYMNLYKN